MTHLFLSDETCLRAACMADVNDDAPWGQYADWLRDHGRDAEADGLRDARVAMRAWPGLTLELAQFTVAGGLFIAAGADTPRHFLPTALPVADFADDGPDRP